MKEAATVLSLILNFTNTNTLGLSEMREKGLKTGFVTIAKWLIPRTRVRNKYGWL